MPNRLSINPLSLILSVAVGLWLGFLAIVATIWLAWPHLPQLHQPVLDAIAPPTAPPAYGTQQQTPEQNRMFEQYKEILRKQEVREAQAQIESDPQNLSNPKCQFWLQQNRTAPTEKSRANVAEFCR